jgi:hypothetical protein
MKSLGWCCNRQLRRAYARLARVGGSGAQVRYYSRAHRDRAVAYYGRLTWRLS